MYPCNCCSYVIAVLSVQLHPGKDPNAHKMDFVLEAGSNMMQLLEGAYSCITLVKGVRQTYTHYHITHGQQPGTAHTHIDSKPMRNAAKSVR